MKVITLTNKKGGCGKTTLTCLLALYWAERKKKHVALKDFDEQGSSGRFVELIAHPRIVPYTGGEDFDYLLGDTPGGVAETQLHRFIDSSDLVLIPMCLSPTDIYKSMLFSSGGLTKVLRRLVESGLIERVENINDKRSRLVKLNARGKQLVETLLPEVHVQQQSLLSGLSKAEVLQLERLLKKALAKHS